MKTAIIYALFFFTSICFSQNDIDFSSPSIEGEFMVKQIIPGDIFYYINIVNDQGDKILIMQEIPKKRILKKNRNNSKGQKIKIGETYFFKLQSKTWSMGFNETGSISVDDIEIWNRKTSDFNVCYAENLEGLFYK